MISPDPAQESVFSKFVKVNFGQAFLDGSQWSEYSFSDVQFRGASLNGAVIRSNNKTIDFQGALGLQ